MKEYHKIQTVYLRDPATNMKTLLEGAWAEPEFEYLANNIWVYTEKVDGTNIRVMIDEHGALSFGGKTDNASIPAALVKRLEELFMPQIELLREAFPSGGCLYGEGYGARIQKGGGNYRPDQDFVLFDVKVGDWWLQRVDVEETGAKFGIPCVPIIGYGSLHDAIEWAICGFTSKWGNFQAEGFVARPKIELKNRAGKRIITKIKHRDFARRNTVEEG